MDCLNLCWLLWSQQCKFLQGLVNSQKHVFIQMCGTEKYWNDKFSDCLYVIELRNITSFCALACLQSCALKKKNETVSLYRAATASMCLTRAGSPKKCFLNTSSTTTWPASFASSICVSFIKQGNKRMLLLNFFHLSFYV